MNTHDHDILEDTLTRLQTSLAEHNYKALKQDFKSESLLCFKQANTAILSQLFTIAHQVVAQVLADEPSPPSSTETHRLHPVYGALIHTLFEDPTRNTELQIHFYQAAGDNYYHAHRFNEALPYYTRAYELSKHLPLSNKKLPEISHELSQRLTQLELRWSVTLYLSKLNTPGFTVDFECIHEGLLLAHQQLQFQLAPRTVIKFYADFKPTLNVYFSQLNAELQRMYAHSSQAQLTQKLNDHLWPIIQIISSHQQRIPGNNACLTELITAGYQLINNLIKNQTMSEQAKTALSLALNEKKNHFAQMNHLELSYDNQHTLIGTTLRKTLAKAERTLAKTSLTQQALADYSNTLKEDVLEPLCRTIQRWLSSPPCEFTLIATGSLARLEAMPSSDLDLAILLNPSQHSSQAIQSLRQAPYFKQFLDALDYGLQLITGRWQINTQPIEHHDRSPHLRQEEHYFRVLNGLRVEPMDHDCMQEAFPPLVQTPDELAKWVVEPLQNPTRQNDKTKILRHSLLHTTTIYSSHPSKKNLHKIYQDTLQQQLNQVCKQTFNHFVFDTASNETVYWHHRWRAYKKKRFGSTPTSL